MILYCKDRIDGVMVSMFALTLVGQGFEPRLGKTKGKTLDICCFSAKHADLRGKSKDWLPRDQKHVF